MFGKRMADITKDAAYMDTVERALYNTLLSGIAMDGKSFFYVNPLEVWPPNCMPKTSKEHVKQYVRHGTECMLPDKYYKNTGITRTVYIFQEKDRIYTNLYISNQAEVEINGVNFNLELKGDFPWKNQMKFQIRKERKAQAAFYFGFPHMRVNSRSAKTGQNVEFTVENGYAKVEAASRKLHGDLFRGAGTICPRKSAGAGRFRKNSAGKRSSCLLPGGNGQRIQSGVCIYTVRSGDTGGVREKTSRRLYGSQSPRKEDIRGKLGRTDSVRRGGPPVLEETELTLFLTDTGETGKREKCSSG